MMYDLEERTARLGEATIKFVQKLPRTIVTTPLVGQLVRSATSVGANYSEADDAESKKDFTHKLGICKKEARETKHWLRMIMVAYPASLAEAQVLWQEAKELNSYLIRLSKK